MLDVNTDGGLPLALHTKHLSKLDPNLDLGLTDDGQPTDRQATNDHPTD